MNVAVERHRNSATFTPYGDIGFADLDQLRDRVAQLPSEVTEVVWDLHAVPFLDIAGLHLFGTPDTPVHVSVTNPPPQPLRLLRLAGELFPDMGWDRHLTDSGAPRAA